MLEKFGVKLNENPTIPSEETITCECGCGYIVHCPFEKVCESEIANYLEQKGISHEKIDEMYGIEDYQEIKGIDEEQFDSNLRDIVQLVAECNVHRTLILMQTFKYECKCYKHGNFGDDVCENDCCYVFGNMSWSGRYPKTSRNHDTYLSYTDHEIKDMVHRIGEIESEHPIGYLEHN
jgi:hypothetical protein